jgi:hypothetical protein
VRSFLLTLFIWLKGRFLERQVNFVELDLGVTEEFIQSVQLVGLEVVNFLDTGVDQDFETVDAWCVGDVNRRILYV